MEEFWRETTKRRVRASGDVQRFGPLTYLLCKLQVQNWRLHNHTLDSEVDKPSFTLSSESQVEIKARVRRAQVVRSGTVTYTYDYDDKLPSSMQSQQSYGPWSAHAPGLESWLRLLGRKSCHLQILRVRESVCENSS